MLRINSVAAVIGVGSLSLSSALLATDGVRSLNSRGPAAEEIANDGVVVLAVRWDRRWKCGGFENAQLRVFAFDKIPSTKGDDATPDLVLDDAPAIATKPKFDNYAFLVPPGEYGLSRVEIKVAKSISEVGFFKVPRSRLMKDGRSEGGSFNVAPGEIVYIGHFYLDCSTRQPTMWRYYPDGKEAFGEYLISLKGDFPWLDASKAIFRLFDTKSFGNDYKLP